MKEERAKKKEAEQQLGDLMETIVTSDDQLYNLGRDVDSVDKMCKYLIPLFMNLVYH